MRKFLIVMCVSIAECKVIKIYCHLGGFLRIIIIIKLKNAKFAAWIKCSAVATAPWFISFENGREFCRKVLLKFYLPHSNLAVRISSEDTIAIAPALIAVSMPVRPCISISVWGLLFYPLLWYAKTRMWDKTDIHFPHLFYLLLWMFV